MASHAVSHRHTLANAVSDPDFPAASTHAYTHSTAISFCIAYFDTHSTAISFYIAYFDTYAGGISRVGGADCKELLQGRAG
jgi:hypothetical protein